jgi:predicted RNA-binding Zn-ribbon protein involved in translation (DUF1610 family)
MEKLVEVQIRVEGLGAHNVQIPSRDAAQLYVQFNEAINEVLRNYNTPKVAHAETGIQQLRDIVTTQALPNSIEVGTLVTPLTQDAISTHSGRYAQRLGEGVHFMVTKEGATSILGKATDEVHEKWHEILARGGNPFTHGIFNNEKIVGFICPHCNGYTARKCKLAESNVPHCHWCKKDVVIKEVTNTTIQCPNCGDQYYIYLANGIKEVGCRKCQSPIDIVYTENGRKGLSANLAKSRE